jgi:hypothetical protein
MNGVLDYFLVGLVLLVSAGYAVLALGPRTMRPRFYAASSRALARAPGWLGLKGIAGRLAAAGGKSAGACGGCGTCGSEPGAADAKTDGEVRIAVTKIGKRA